MPSHDIDLGTLGGDLEVVRRLTDVMDRLMERPDDLPAALEFIDPDVEWIPLRAALEGAYHGHDGFSRFVTDTQSTFETFEVHFELSELGAGQVLAWGSLHVRAKGSGAEVDVPLGGIFEVRDGRVTRWRD